MSIDEGIVQDWYEASYLKGGFASQRNYPNEEFCRFMGRRFFSIPYPERRQKKILEIGCGSGANLWMVAKEGFSASGIDLSKAAIELCSLRFKNMNLEADLRVGSMTELPYEERTFDAIADIFSAYCLGLEDFVTCLKSVKNCLKIGGAFFSYTPGKNSDAFTYPGTSRLLDASTLDGISREDSPFFGNAYPFRFDHPREMRAMLEAEGFRVEYLETISRTYNMQNEKFEFLVVEAIRTN